MRALTRLAVLATLLLGRAQAQSQPEDPLGHALAFPGIIGATIASAEICHIPVDQSARPLAEARLIAQARYRQLGQPVQAELDAEARSLGGYLRTHARVPALPDCRLFARQMANLDRWAAEQAADALRAEVRK